MQISRVSLRQILAKCICFQHASRGNQQPQPGLVVFLDSVQILRGAGIDRFQRR